MCGQFEYISGGTAGPNRLNNWQEFQTKIIKCTKCTKENEKIRKTLFLYKYIKYSLSNYLYTAYLWGANMGTLVFF